MFEQLVRGKVLKYGDNLDTDRIYASGKHPTLDHAEMAKYAMEAADPNFPEKVKKANIIVAGTNFGCGSSREKAPLALKYSGVRVILADSFARIFYRNALNVGLPVIECEGVSKKIQEGDEVEVDLKSARIIDRTNGEELKGLGIPDFLLIRLQKGGLIPFLVEERASKTQP
jgi:3-isopropylmalate/(R)-2-methylmalate dehydratase small subunit